MSEVISSIPTNIITGFLGVGKTSAILHLLKSKPSDERWAVLVNEFGEIGVDGSLFEGEHNAETGVFIREVPGGCMCCTAGLPMQIALNQLLTRAKPHRLLIEPTGLGHPKEVLEALCAEHYREVIELEKIITLVDARKVSDERYTNHDTFNQQIAIADIIIGNKTDLYQATEKSALENYVNNKGSKDVQIYFTEHGALKPEWLSGKTARLAKSESHSHQHTHHHTHAKKDLVSEREIPSKGYLKAENSGEGYYSIGWRFCPKIIFDRQKLFEFLSGLRVERMKAVFITEQGIFGYNLTKDALTEVVLDDCLESRIEIIASDIVKEWESRLLDCRNHQSN